MKTDVITVSSKGNRMGSALREAEKVAVYKELSPQSALHLRLLTEEMMGMMRSITGETEGLFWIEDQDGLYQLHLQVRTRMDMDKREQLLAASSTGRNESAKGLMGRLRDFFDRSADDSGYLSTSPLLLPGVFEHSSTPTLEWEWSMSVYEDQLSRMIEEKNEKAQEMWDELEKSVVVHVADDVKVSIKGQVAELIIYKKMA